MSTSRNDWLSPESKGHSVIIRAKELWDGNKTLLDLALCVLVINTILIPASSHWVEPPVFRTNNSSYLSGFSFD